MRLGQIGQYSSVNCILAERRLMKFETGTAPPKAQAS